MRIILMINKNLPSHTKIKIGHFITKQKQWLSLQIHMNMNLETLSTFDNNENTTRVFITMDCSEWHSCYVLTFPTHLDKESIVQF